MRAAAAVLLATALLLPVACSQPIPPEKLSYAGEWRAAHMRLLITPQGRVDYERRHDGSSKSVKAPIQRFEGDDFIVGIGPLSTRFVVSAPPHLEAGRWKMTVDGVELTRVMAYEGTRA